MHHCFLPDVHSQATKICCKLFAFWHEQVIPTAFTDEKQTWSYLVCLCLPFPNDKKNHQVVYFNIVILKKVTADEHWVQWPVFDSQQQEAQTLGQV